MPGLFLRQETPLSQSSQDLRPPELFTMVYYFYHLFNIGFFFTLFALTGIQLEKREDVATH